MNHKYTTNFETFARAIVAPEQKQQFLASASLDVLKSVFGAEIPKNEDLLPLVGLLCTFGAANKNDDAVTIEDGLKIYPSFQKKFLSIDHSRKDIKGYISNVGLTRYSDNTEVTAEEVLKENTVYNLSIGCLLWKILSPKLSEYLIEASDPLSDEYQTTSLSFEVGFEDYKIGMGSKIIREAKVIDDPEQIKKLSKYLKAEGGSGKTDKGERVYRILAGTIFGIGASLVSEPASGLKGILAIDSNAPETANRLSSIDAKLEVSVKDLAEGLSRTGLVATEMVKNFDKVIIAQKNSVINNTIIKNTKSMDKITKITDLTDETIKECKASVVSEFLDSEILRVNSEWKAKMEAKDRGTKDITDKTEVLATDLRVLTDKFANTQKELEKLHNEAAQRSAQETFSQRMVSFDNLYELSQEDRAEIAAQVKDLDNAGFEKISNSFKTLLKEKNKEVIKAKQSLEVKASVNTDTATAAAGTVVDAAVDNSVKDKTVVPNTTTAAAPSLSERMRKGFKMENWLSVSK